MSPESVIGHYRITAKLGEGGMGAVFRATDTKLGRDVAIKVLPESFAADPDRVARFTREAHVLASLNHPNIAAIYGVEDRALVMELVPGPTLAERIAEGAIPLEEALPIARQIAEALEYAHERGIIHRDLKPANTKVTPEGRVKVLDFGLAKALASDTGSADPFSSPTLTMSATRTGVILGTAAYMSPEQARGKPVDRRADIWAFGVLLHEMLTGFPLFGGDTLTETIASVLKAEPDWTALPADTPPHIRWLLERCLRKDPAKRLQAIGDARLLMDEPPRSAPARARESSLPRWLPLIATALAGVASTAAMWWYRAKPVDLVTARFALTLPEGTVEPSARNAPQVVPSPDGRYLAFIAHDVSTDKDYLWVRPLSSLSARRLDRSEGANFPFWSPDGQFIGFFADQKLKKIAVSGEFVQVICDIGHVSGAGGSWNQSGTMIFALSQQGPLMRVQAAGGSAIPVTVLDTNRGEVRYRWPQFLPDGKHFIYLAKSADPVKTGIYIQELDAGDGKLVLPSMIRAAYAPLGYLLFAREAMLYAQRLDPSNFQVRGEPVPLAEISVNLDNGNAAFAVSANGVLVYRREAIRNRQLTWYDREGKRLGLVGAPGDYQLMQVSPDEKHVALLRGSAALGFDTWVMDLKSGILRKTTWNSKQRPSIPVWSPDSRRIVTSLEGGGLRETVVVSGATNILSTDSAASVAYDWTAAGRFLLCANSPATQISLLPVSTEGVSSTGKLQTILDTPYNKYGLRVSPHGQSVAYITNELGGSDVYVAPFPSFAEKHQVSTGGGLHPHWRKDGKELFFPTINGMVMAADVKTGAKLEVGIPKPLFKINVDGFSQFAAAGDGRRFLVNEVIGQTEGQTTVVLNWAAGIKQ